MKNKIRKKEHLFYRIFLFFSLFMIITGGILVFIKVSNLKVEAIGAFEENKKQDLIKTPDEDYSYVIVNKSSDPIINIGDSVTLFLEIKNTGNMIWLNEGNNSVFLGASRSQDRDTIFYTEGNKGWASGNRIEMKDDKVFPGQKASFVFKITAPRKPGVYREYFTPLVEYKEWMNGDFYWDIEVIDPNNPNDELVFFVNNMPWKYIKVKLEEQRLYAYEDGLIKYDFVVSTGKEGMDTPTGELKIYNKFPSQFSSAYDLYMDNWMAITADARYGIHSLPYWKLYSGGRLYEGEDHLGTKISHGCIRLGLEESKIIYDWAEVGMMVYIED